MLSIVHDVSGSVSRRAFVQAGVLACGGLTLADVLRASAGAGAPNSRKSVIFVHLDGGPPQHETIDPKPLAPVEIRGDLTAISSSIPGVEFGELLPRMALRAERFALIRSLVGSAGQHDAFQCQSGFSHKDLQSIGGRPALGCVVSKLQGQPTDPAPSFADLMQGRALVRNSARAGFLGPAFQPFRPDLSGMFQRELEPGMKNELARLGGEHATSLKLDPSLSEVRLNSRTELLGNLDLLRREVDGSGMMDAMDQFTSQAVGILTSGKLADALDLSKEDPRVLDRYTPPVSDTQKRFYTAEGPESVRKFLLARRLIEAGVRVVSLSLSDFDTHSSNFTRMRDLLPLLDYGLTTLIDDLDERGMLEDVAVVAWGEFGRTPRINDNAGRDHWPRVGPAILAGGSFRTGQVIGATDRTASTPIARPVTYKEIMATLYRHLGIDALQTTLLDPRGRPLYLLDEGEPIPELV